MDNKLRSVYDRLYIKTETMLLALGYTRKDRHYAALVKPLPTLDEDYRTVVRPYWKKYQVRVPKKFHFRLFCNAEKGVETRLDPRYIPDDLWFGRIVPYYNNLIFAKAMQDKCLHSLLFPEVRRPVTVVKRIAGVFYDDSLHIVHRADAAALCTGRGRVIVKPSVSTGQGRNIHFYDTDDWTPEDAEKMFDRSGNNFVVQEKQAQHPDLARLNPDSLNSIRIISFLKDDEVHILTQILRVGGFGSEVDNISQGGYQCAILPDGRLADRGFTYRNGRWEYAEAYPNGIRFEDVTVPSFDRAREIVRTQAARMSHFKLIGWDFAVAPDGEPVFIEFNVIPAQDQESTGPTFGDLTDEVLAEVFGTHAAPGGRDKR